MITKSSQTVVRRDVAIPDGLAFRAAVESDEPFLLSSFRLVQRDKGCLLDRRMQFSDAMDVLTEVLRNVVKKATIIVLYDTNDASCIIGWTIFERFGRKLCVHYAYVKEAFRGLGYGTLLYQFATRSMHEDDPVWVSTLTARARNILDEHRIPWAYKPALLFSTETFPKEQQEEK